MNPRGVDGTHSAAAPGASATTERGGEKPGGFAALLSQLGVGTRTAGEDSSGAKDRRPGAPSPATTSPATTLTPAMTTPPAVTRPAAATMSARQILPSPIAAVAAESEADAAPAPETTLARPLQTTSSMLNNAAHSRFEASRLVAMNGGELRAATAKALGFEIQLSDTQHAKVLTDGASRKSDVAMEAPHARNLTKEPSRPAAIQVPASSVRAATLSSATYTPSAAPAGHPAPNVQPTTSPQAAPLTPSFIRLEKSAAPHQFVTVPAEKPSASAQPGLTERAEPRKGDVVARDARSNHLEEKKPAPLTRSAAPAVAANEAKAAAPMTASERPRPIFTANDAPSKAPARLAPEAPVSSKSVAPLETAKPALAAKALPSRAGELESPKVESPKVEAAKVEAKKTPAETIAPRTETPASPRLSQPTAAITAKDAAPTEPASVPAPKRSFAKPEPAPSIAPQSASAPLAASETAPPAHQSPAGSPPASLKAPASTATVPTDDRRVTAHETPAQSLPSETRPAAVARKNPAPARGKAEADAAAQAPALPIAMAQPAAPAMVTAPPRPVAPEAAAPATDNSLKIEKRQAQAARAHASAEPAELTWGERRKPAAHGKSDERSEAIKPGVEAGVPAQIVPPVAFERVAHRAAGDSHGKVDGFSRRDHDGKEPSRAADRPAEQAALPLAGPASAPEQNPLRFDPGFTAQAPLVQPDAAPPVAFAPQAAAPIVAQAAEDAGLSVTILPQSARLSVESSEGDLALHLRIKDGNAEVSIGGSLAPMFEQRSAEVQSVLAGEGLSLGRFDTSDNNRQGQQAPRDVPGDDARPARPGTTTAHSSDTAGVDQPVRSLDGRYHVTA
jgi:hypothetical protein